MKAFKRLRSWVSRDSVSTADYKNQQVRPDQQSAKQLVNHPAAQFAANNNNVIHRNKLNKIMSTAQFFSEYGEANRYEILEVIGKGSYGVVCSALDRFTGEKVAIKKIRNVFEHVSDATRILREIKLLRFLKHPDIVQLKHIMLPPSPRDFQDIFVVFELMETDLHQVIKANDNLTPEHHQFFLYQLLRGLKFIHTAKVFHRDLKPKNILANSNCKLKICDFGLARPMFSDMPTTIYWTDYVATRWYRAPELCGSFFAKYSPAVDIWSVGCIFAEVLLGKPLFPGRNVVHQLELITDMLGTPSHQSIAQVRNKKSQQFLLSMPTKQAMDFAKVFPNTDPNALNLLKRLLAFDPAERPTAEEALADPYFKGLQNIAREPAAEPVSKLAFDFEKRKLSIHEVRELIYKEALEYHPKMKEEFLKGIQSTGNFVYPSAAEYLKRQFAMFEQGAVRGSAQIAPYSSMPKESISEYVKEAVRIQQQQQQQLQQQQQQQQQLQQQHQQQSQQQSLSGQYQSYLQGNYMYNVAGGGGSMGMSNLYRSSSYAPDSQTRL
eukprot:TRINITY_DN6036_c0_g1_i5.p1 TRINITY_DN6036_c0_g1~~TRINITY_DN6036_c0_g1_i5.p1  ORF type:complete len:550 (+),score=62.39 TRINITY_DN6036_c0_g1_i5:126-1775(+)